MYLWQSNSEIDFNKARPEIARRVAIAVQNDRFQSRNLKHGKQTSASMNEFAMLKVHLSVALVPREFGLHLRPGYE